MRFRRCPKCDRQHEIYVVICDCGYQFSDTDKDPSDKIVFGALVGVVVGAMFGYLLRPAIPLIGQQLPFEAVITRGGSLKGLDQLLVGLAQQSFNYLVLGTLIGGIAGAVVGYFARAATNAKPAPVPANSIQASAGYQPQAVSPSLPVTVQLGDSREAVVATLGAPQKVMDLGPKTLYVYPDLKITFVDGKVSDVQ